MSAGNFNTVRYEGDDGVLYKCRIQPETTQLEIEGVANLVPAEPAGTVKSKISARVNGSRRGIGLYARLVRVKFGDTDGAQPDGYKRGGTITLPILTKSLFDTIDDDQSGTYLGKVVSVVGTVNEVMA